jgi:hypothetical protein
VKRREFITLIGDGATERFGKLEKPLAAHGTLAFFPCLDRLIGDAEPRGQLLLR